MIGTVTQQLSIKLIHCQHCFINAAETDKCIWFMRFHNNISDTAIWSKQTPQLFPLDAITQTAISNNQILQVQNSKHHNNIKYFIHITSYYEVVSINVRNFYCLYKYKNARDNLNYTCNIRLVLGMGTRVRYPVNTRVPGSRSIPVSLILQ